MVVSDSSALIVLLDLGRMELLSNLFSGVMIPPAVHEEISFRYPVVLPNFITIKAPKDSTLLVLLHRLLDPGESEAIALALEEDRRLIIDERKGRKIAVEQGLKITGLLGVVYLNVREGWLTIDEARLFMGDAREHGYRISQKLVNEMLDLL
jgi:predicted nucleic acid-binding protein